MRYRIGDNIVFRNTRPDLVMAYDKASGVMYEMNDTATSILKLINGERDFDAIVTGLLEEFDGDREQVASDVQQLLARLMDVSVVVAE